MGAFESGQSLIAGVLEKLPESLRAQAKAVFDAAEAKDAITVIGDSALARSDYSKHMDKIRTDEAALADQRATLDRWYSVNKPALDEYVKFQPQLELLKAGGTVTTEDPDDPSKRTVVKPAALDQDAIEKIAQARIDAVAPDMVGISAWMAAKAVEHRAMFGETPSLYDCVNEAVKQRAQGKNFTLDDAYNAKYSEKLQTYHKTEEDKRIDTLVQQKLVEERSKAPGSQPFPLRSEASPLDLLGTPTNNRPDPGQFTVDASVAEYNRLQAQRG